MKHNVKTKKLNRDTSHRKSLKRNMADQIVLHEKIETTIAKAKAIRPYIERLITKAKQKSSSKTDEFNKVKYLRKKMSTESAVKKLLKDIGPRYESRDGGYTRIIRTRNRDGDKTMMGIIELVQEKKEEKKAPSVKASKSTRRSKKESAKKENDNVETQKTEKDKPKKAETNDSKLIEEEQNETE